MSQFFLFSVFFVSNCHIFREGMRCTSKQYFPPENCNFPLFSVFFVSNCHIFPSFQYFCLKLAHIQRGNTSKQYIPPKRFHIIPLFTIFRRKLSLFLLFLTSCTQNILNFFCQLQWRWMRCKYQESLDGPGLKKLKARNKNVINNSHIWKDTQERYIVTFKLWIIKGSLPAPHSGCFSFWKCYVKYIQILLLGLKWCNVESTTLSEWKFEITLHRVVLARSTSHRFYFPIFLEISSSIIPTKCSSLSVEK